MMKQKKSYLESLYNNKKVKIYYSKEPLVWDKKTKTFKHKSKVKED